MDDYIWENTYELILAASQWIDPLTLQCGNKNAKCLGGEDSTKGPPPPAIPLSIPPDCLWLAQATPPIPMRFGSNANVGTPRATLRMRAQSTPLKVTRLYPRSIGPPWVYEMSYYLYGVSKEWAVYITAGCSVRAHARGSMAWVGFRVAGCGFLA